MPTEPIFDDPPSPASLPTSLTVRSASALNEREHDLESPNRWRRRGGRRCIQAVLDDPQRRPVAIYPRPQGVVIGTLPWAPWGVHLSHDLEVVDCARLQRDDDRSETMDVGYLARPPFACDGYPPAKTEPHGDRLREQIGRRDHWLDREILGCRWGAERCCGCEL